MCLETGQWKMSELSEGEGRFMEVSWKRIRSQKQNQSRAIILGPLCATKVNGP